MSKYLASETKKQSRYDLHAYQRANFRDPLPAIMRDPLDAFCHLLMSEKNERIILAIC